MTVQWRCRFCRRLVDDPGRHTILCGPAHCSYDRVSDVELEAGLELRATDHAAEWNERLIRRAVERGQERAGRPVAIVDPVYRAIADRLVARGELSRVDGRYASLVAGAGELGRAA